jgi:hypothetical protein
MHHRFDSDIDPSNPPNAAGRVARWAESTIRRENIREHRGTVCYPCPDTMKSAWMVLTVSLAVSPATAATAGVTSSGAGQATADTPSPPNRRACAWWSKWPPRSAPAIILGKESVVTPRFAPGPNAYVPSVCCKGQRMPEGKFEVELVMDPTGQVVAAWILGSTPPLTRNQRDILLEWLRTRRYEPTMVLDAPAYVCLASVVSIGTKAGSASPSPSR